MAVSEEERWRLDKEIELDLAGLTRRIQGYLQRVSLEKLSQVTGISQRYLEQMKEAESLSGVTLDYLEGIRRGLGILELQRRFGDLGMDPKEFYDDRF